MPRTTRVEILRSDSKTQLDCELKLKRFGMPVSIDCVTARCKYRITFLSAVFVLLMLLLPCLPSFANGQFPTVSIETTEEVVYKWGRDRCENWDIPDTPLRAFRSGQNEITASASTKNNWYFVGTDFDHLNHKCESLLQYKESFSPEDYSGYSYLSAYWAEAGLPIIALVHNEFHAEKYKACSSAESIACWYNTIIEAWSRDGGHSFQMAKPPILVAGISARQDVEQGRHRGFFNPSNIFSDGKWLYVLIHTTGMGPQKAGVCLFRKSRADWRDNWKAFDGAEFNSQVVDPYRLNASHFNPCEPIRNLPVPVGSVVRHQNSGKYLSVMVLGPTADWPDGAVAYSWSSDLLHWSEPRPLLVAQTMFSKGCASEYSYGYASLIDPLSPSRNFDIIGDGTYVYLTKFHLQRCKQGPDRDLVRIKLFINSESTAK